MACYFEVDEHQLALNTYFDNNLVDEVPHLKFDHVFGVDVTSAHEEEFLRLFSKHGFVILSQVSAEKQYRDLEKEMMKFFISANKDLKAKSVGEIYVNERGTPMFYSGYEHVEDKVREAFRVHATSQGLAWPSKRLPQLWHSLTSTCSQITDRALALALVRSKHITSNEESTTKKPTLDQEIASIEKNRRTGDFSVAYALHYPNFEGGAPTLSQNVAGEKGINVKAHVDPSLFVLEPVSDVAGLDVFDQASKQWLSVENVSRHPGSDWVLFGGRCLEKVTNGMIKACLHRVTADGYHEDELAIGKRRFCFIYEQKLADFYDE
mmetsp:Transcript_50951/g.65248  ORF Transcript_50951/g.65248 Transcript_50951/m.65248 type:complete len:322 (+) Transcript_50951:88-1053(+)